MTLGRVFFSMNFTTLPSLILTLFMFFYQFPLLISIPLHGSQYGYPWSTTTSSFQTSSIASPELNSRHQLYQKQQLSILNKLSSLHLEILNSSLPYELLNGNSLSFSSIPSNQLSNSPVINYTCSHSSLTENSSPNQVLPSLAQSESTMLQFLSKSLPCYEFHIDWWSYQWCSEIEVHQFHLETKRKNKVVKNPNWSLGKYDLTDSIRDDNEQITKVIQYYSGGQICHENNHHRSTEVHFVCCDRNRHEKRSPKDIPQDQLITFHRKFEPDLCQYTIEVCTPLLCPALMYPSIEAHTPSPTYSLVEFMTALQKTCMARQESWWSYEVCFRPPGLFQDKSLITDNSPPTETNPATPPHLSGARQYRATTVVTQEGKKVSYAQIIEAEFYLGSPPLAIYNNETALREVVVTPRPTVVHRVGSSLSHHSSNSPTAALHLEFSGGKACDIEDTLRGATMEITCGTRDGIEDIIEDRTCHYLFKISSKALCLVEGFAPPKQNISHISCQSNQEVKETKLPSPQENTPTPEPQTEEEINKSTPVEKKDREEEAYREEGEDREEEEE